VGVKIKRKKEVPAEYTACCCNRSQQRTSLGNWIVAIFYPNCVRMW